MITRKKITRWIVWSLILWSSVWKIPSRRELNFIIMASLVLYLQSPKTCDSLWCNCVSTSWKVWVHLSLLLWAQSNWESEITALNTIFFLLCLFFFLVMFLLFPNIETINLFKKESAWMNIQHMHIHIYCIYNISTALL